MITQAELKELLDYDPLTGVFRWKVSISRGRGGKTNIGDVAGVNCNHGYIRIRLNGKNHYAHRLAWLYMTGILPEQVDHDNGKRNDNSFNNLKSTNNLGNQQNRGLDKRNKSGYQGVSWAKTKNKWKAQICCNYKQKHLGLYNTPEEAYEAYKAAKAELHSFSPVPRQ